jgi:hypothetical protein
MTKDEALKRALDDLMVEYDMERTSFAKRVDEIFKPEPVQEPVEDATMQSLKDLWRSVCDEVGKAAFAQPEQEPICPECGLLPLTVKHEWVDMTPEDYAEIFVTARSVDHAARLTTAKLKEKNA